MCSLALAVPAQKLAVRQKMSFNPFDFARDSGILRLIPTELQLHCEFVRPTVYAV